MYKQYQVNVSIQFCIYRILARLLSQSNDNVVLAIAAHDLGQYVKYYPNGKKYGWYFYIALLIYYN